MSCCRNSPGHKPLWTWSQEPSRPILESLPNRVRRASSTMRVARRGVAALGPEVWRGERPPWERGYVAFDTPIGMPEYVRSWGAERLEVEDELLRQLPLKPDLQSAWLLSFCAALRANHALRTVFLPDLIAPYAVACGMPRQGHSPSRTRNAFFRMRQRTTSGRNASPVAMPCTPPPGLRIAVVRVIAMPSAIWSGIAACASSTNGSSSGHACGS